MKDQTTWNQLRLAAALAVAVLLLPAGGFAAEFTGKLIGRHCAMMGTVCPLDRLDPHIQLEEDFVLVGADGSYYVLPNLSRDLKVRYVLQDIQVNGAPDADFNAIRVDEFRVRDGQQYRTVWSQAMLDRERSERCQDAKVRLAKAGDSYYEKPAAWKAVRKFCKSDN